MDYTIVPSVDGPYINVKVRGNITRREAVQINLEAHALGKQLRINRYLVDVTEARNTDPIIEIYTFAYSDMLNGGGIDGSEIVAVLVSPDDHSHDFAETVCRNAGFNVTMFRGLNEARQALAGLKVPGRGGGRGLSDCIREIIRR